MTKDVAEWIVVTVMVAVIFAVVIGILAVAGAVKCSWRWGDSGMSHRFRPISGCQLETRPGRWIPADRFRELDR